VEAVASELERTKGLALSGRQYSVLCSILRTSGDPEVEARRLGLMKVSELMDLIGERSV